jgi:Na+-driven multidrug efflux pump
MPRAKDSRLDLTRAPIGRSLLMFSLPTLGSNILQSLNGSINTIWVGRFLGEDALAATSNANIIMFLMFSAVFGFGMAATVMVGQSIGRGDVDGARRAFGSAVGLVMTGKGILISLILTSTMVGVVILLDRPVMALFVSSDSPAIAIARHIQLIASWNFVLFGATMVFFSTVRANGAVLVPLAILVVALYPVRIGFAYFGRDWIGPDALWWSFPLGSVVTLALSATYYLNGSWRKGSLSVPAGQGEMEDHALAGAEPAGRMQPGA